MREPYKACASVYLCRQVHIAFGGCGSLGHPEKLLTICDTPPDVIHSAYSRPVTLQRIPRKIGFHRSSLVADKINDAGGGDRADTFVLHNDNNCELYDETASRPHEYQSLCKIHSLVVLNLVLFINLLYKINTGLPVFTTGVVFYLFKRFSYRIIV